MEVNKKIKVLSRFLILYLFVLALIPLGSSACAIYFTAVGCPHCAKTDPFIFKEIVRKYNLILIEYEIAKEGTNAPLLLIYSERYNRSDWLGVPLIIFDEKKYIIGDIPILDNLEKYLKETKDNKCLLLNGKVDFENIDLNSLPGRPKIWYGDRVLVKGSKYLDMKIVKELLLNKNISVLEKFDTYRIKSCIPYSGGEVCFDNAVRFNEDWEFYWNGKSINVSNISSYSAQNISGRPKVELTLGKIVSLAVVDSINPCALAVLTLMLVAILTYNPKNKYKVLLAGLAFSFSVYFMYLLYGLVIVKFFQIISQLVIAKIYIYKALAIFAIILGLLNIKDYLKYKPGGLLREMPMSWRPKVKKIISGITSPLGAGLVGLFVTVFLLPCTMGPYIIAGGILSALEFVKTIPWLLLYNLIFISPMLLITFLVYFGYTTVEKVKGWREENIRLLHGIAGTIMLILGILMLFGII